jgi:methylase of polypeptide subunit release factors
MKDGRKFDPRGIKHIKVTGGLPISEAIHNHPDLLPYLRTRDPPRIDNESRDALLLYNKYIALDSYGLDIIFESDVAIVPTPVMRYNFLSHLLPASKKPHIMEIGTGASAIIALLAAKHFGARVWATEVNPEYIQLARKNVERNGFSDRIEIIDSRGKMIEGVIDPNMQFDFIISNPPYYDEVRSAKILWGGTPGELVGGEAGERFVLQMIQEGWSHLKSSGVMSFIIPKTRDETLVKIEDYLTEAQYEYDIIGLLAGNRTRYVFRIFKDRSEIHG